MALQLLVRATPSLVMWLEGSLWIQPLCMSGLGEEHQLVEMIPCWIFSLWRYQARVSMCVRWRWQWPLPFSQLLWLMLVIPLTWPSRVSPYNNEYISRFILSPSLHPFLVPPPSVSLSSPLTGVFSGQSVVLTCTIVLDSSVDTSVTVAVQWFNPASTIIDNTMTTMQTQTSLTYQSTTNLSDFIAGAVGVYSCAAMVTSTRGFTSPSDSVSASTNVSLSKSLTSHYLIG